jgi:hypothetical protein
MEPTPDHLSKVLREWKPEPAGSTREFVDETMRKLRAEPVPPRLSGFAVALERLFQEWLPSPGILVMVSAVLILMMGVQYWAMASRQARTDAAMLWHREISQPFSKMSLSGAYVRLEKE